MKTNFGIRIVIVLFYLMFFFFSISQDPRTGCWHFHVSKEEILVGYLRKVILPNLKDGAEIVA